MSRKHGKADGQQELAAAMQSDKPVAKKPAKAKKAKKTRIMFATPDAAKLKMLYEAWRQGNTSLWDLKKRFHVKASAMLPAFKKMATKDELKLLSRGPAARVPVGKLEKAKQAVALKKTARTAEPDTPAQLKRRVA